MHCLLLKSLRIFWSSNATILLVFHTRQDENGLRPKRWGESIWKWIVSGLQLLDQGQTKIFTQNSLRGSAADVHFPCVYFRPSQWYFRSNELGEHGLGLSINKSISRTLCTNFPTSLAETDVLSPNFVEHFLAISDQLFLYRKYIFNISYFCWSVKRLMSSTR